MAPFAALLTSVAILLMGNGLQATLLPVRANLEAFSGASIGLLGSTYFIGFTLGCLGGQLLISRAGHIRAYLMLVSVASTVALLHAVVVDPVTWWFLRAVTGFCFSALFVIIESWINERSDNTTRGTVFSIYTIINMTVITIGQLMLTLSDPKLFPLFALASILVSLSAVPIALTRSPSPEPVPIVLPRLWRLYESAPVGFLGSFTFGLTSGAFWGLGPVFAMESGLNTFGISVFMSATLLGGAAGQWPLGSLSDAIDRRMVILASCILAAIGGLALGHWYEVGATALFALGFGYGIFAFPVYSLSVAHANDHAVAMDYVETSSGLLLVYGAGAIAGPALASMAIGLGGQQALFTYIAVVFVLMAGFTLWRIRKRPAISEEEKVDFSDALMATLTLSPVEVVEGSEEEEKPDAG